MTDDEMKELLMRLFCKLNGDLPPIDTQLGVLFELFDEVIKEYKDARPAK